MSTAVPSPGRSDDQGGDRSSGAHVHGDVSGGAVTQVAGNQYNYYQLVGDLPAVQAASAGRSWTIPPPVRSFTGRDEQIAALRAQLTGEGAATLVPTAAVYGMGGIGKTQLALAYAHRYRAEYELGWWVPAETELTMLTALSGVAIALGLPAELPPAELAIRVPEVLAERSGWLLIFDNAPDAVGVAAFLPAIGGGHVLVTSRNPAWQGIADPFAVDLLPLEEAVRLLISRSGDRDEQAASALAEQLGRLPLALEQAAAYAAQQHMPLGRYLTIFRERRVQLLSRGRPLAYHGTVDTTFTLAVEQLAKDKPATVVLLRICALLGPDELPVHLLLSEPNVLPEPLAAVARDPVDREELAGALYQAGLLTEYVSDAARLHRLVQTVILEHLSNAERKHLVEQAARLLCQLFPSQGREPDHWPRCAQLLPHVQALLNHAIDAKIIAHELANLLVITGIYLRARALFNEARELDEQALRIYQQLYSGDHSDVASSLNNLANSVCALGGVRRAQKLHEEALAMRQRLYKGDHPEVAASLNNLAVDLFRLGNLERARELDEEALAMRQRLCKGDHPEVAASLSNLAGDLFRFGESERARELEQEALAMRQRLYGGDHPEIATSLSNLASDLRTRYEHERALELEQEALAMRQRLYGGDHPEIATSLSNLAEDLIAVRKHERAQALDEQALAMRQRLMASGDPEIARSNLAAALRMLDEMASTRGTDETDPPRHKSGR